MTSSCWLPILTSSVTPERNIAFRVDQVRAFETELVLKLGVDLGQSWKHGYAVTS